MEIIESKNFNNKFYKIAKFLIYFSLAFYILSYLSFITMTMSLGDTNDVYRNNQIFSLVAPYLGYFTGGVGYIFLMISSFIYQVIFSEKLVNFLPALDGLRWNDAFMFVFLYIPPLLLITIAYVIFLRQLRRYKREGKAVALRFSLLVIYLPVVIWGLFVLYRIIF